VSIYYTIVPLVSAMAPLISAYITQESYKIDSDISCWRSNKNNGKNVKHTTSP